MESHYRFVIKSGLKDNSLLRQFTFGEPPLSTALHVINDATTRITSDPVHLYQSLLQQRPGTNGCGSFNGGTQTSAQM